MTSRRSPFGATFAPCGIMRSSAYTDAARSTADTANSDLHLRFIAYFMADMFNFHVNILSNSAIREHTQSGTNQDTHSYALFHLHAQEERGRRTGRSSSRSATICAGVTTMGFYGIDHAFAPASRRLRRSEREAEISAFISSRVHSRSFLAMRSTRISSNALKASRLGAKEEISHPAQYAARRSRPAGSATLHWRMRRKARHMRWTLPAHPYHELDTGLKSAQF